jgi:DNA primase
MLSASLRESLEAATSTYQTALMETREALEYLARRGIDATTAATFHLGFVIEPVLGHEQYVNRLAIPYVTPAGVVDIRFRSIVSDDSPKYMSRTGATGHLYNVSAFGEDSPIIAITEGEMDTIVTHGLAGIPSVGVPGANAWKPFYHRAFQDYDRVFLLCDGDSPGREWGKRIASEIETAVIVSMPDGMDVNDYVLAHGEDGLRKKVGL